MFKKIYLILQLICFPIASYPNQFFKGMLKQSINYNPAIKSAKNQIEAAAHEIDSSRWSYYPTPSVAYERANKFTIGMLNKNTKYIRLQQPIWTAGRLDAQHDKSVLNYEIAEATFDDLRIQSAFKWLQLWAEYKNASERMEIFKQSEKNHYFYVTQIQKRAEMGFAARSDIQLALSRLNSIKTQILQSSYSKNLATNKLEQMLDERLPSEDNIVDELIWPVDVKEVNVWEDKFTPSELDYIISSHPIIRKSISLVNSAEQDVKIIQSKNIPEVYIRGEIRQGDVTGMDRSFFIGINSNFGAGLSAFAAIASAQSKVDSLQNEIETKKRDIREQVEADLQKNRSQIAQLYELEKNLSNNRDYLESSERQYLAGRRTWQEVMNNAREEVQIQSQIADSKAQIWLAHQKLQIFFYGLDLYLSEHPIKMPNIKNQERIN